MGWAAHVIFGLDSPNMNLPVQVVTMSKKRGGGGARRNKVPEVDEEHLLDSLEAWRACICHGEILEAGNFPECEG